VKTSLLVLIAPAPEQDTSPANPTMSCRMQQAHAVDVNTLQCAADLISRIASRVVNPPRLPEDSEIDTLDTIGRLMHTPFDLAQHERLLQRIWRASFGTDRHFQPVSRLWCEIGFQQANPGSDVRGGGELALEALCFLCERHRCIFRYLILSRDRRRLRGPFASYPIACAAISILRKLTELLHVLQPLTGKALQAYQSTPLSFWHVVRSKNSFFELFVAVFVLLDRLWDEQGASYMQFNAVLDTAIVQTASMLNRLPRYVLPHALSFATEELHREIDNPDSFELVVDANGIMPTGYLDELEADEEQERRSQNSDPSSGEERSRTSQSSDLDVDPKFRDQFSEFPIAQLPCSSSTRPLKGGSVCETGDLLGLADLQGPGAGESDELFRANSGLLGAPPVDFFASYGLED